MAQILDLDFDRIQSAIEIEHRKRSKRRKANPSLWFAPRVRGPALMMSAASAAPCPYDERRVCGALPTNLRATILS